LRGKLETIVGIFILAALGIFLYMGFQVGTFRFDRAKYANYKTYFKDISGLSRKAEVKIAGVKVGWVEKLGVIPDGEPLVQADLMVHRDYKLYKNASAVVRQDGLLGPKFLELVPGDPYLETISPGSVLLEPSESPASIDEILKKFDSIASHVEDVTESFKDAVGGVEGSQQLTSIFSNLERAAIKIASFSDTFDRSLSRNEQNIDAFLEVGQDIKRLSKKLEESVLPAFQGNMERISDVFDRDFDRVATKLETTAQSIDEASLQAREGLRNISSVAEKIDEGKGLLGKLINEDETYKDLKVAVGGLKNYFSQIDRMQFVFDTHFEGFYRPAENYEYEDSKGYFDVRVHPDDDHFYILQLAASERGNIKRFELDRKYFDDEGCPVNTDSLELKDKVEHTYRMKADFFKRNTISLGLQFGKIFKNVAFRVGLFESSAGGAIDINIPFSTDKFRWVTSFEIFDTTGWNRRNRKYDRRPHLKWINRMFFMRNLYAVFGADDFVSKKNGNVFFGAGIRFGDDDVKYLFTSLGSSIGGVTRR